MPDRGDLFSHLAPLPEGNVIKISASVRKLQPPSQREGDREAVVVVRNGKSVMTARNTPSQLR